jgi:non-ribosomal peptide synthetase-like protein
MNQSQVATNRARPTIGRSGRPRSTLLRDGSTSDFLLTAEGYDDSVRWQPGERLHHLFEERCDRFDADGDPEHLAVDGPHGALTFHALDARANRIARHLADRGVVAGDRVGLLFDGSPDMYATMLAVSKLHAAYVPLDPGFPADRIAFIVEDARVGVLVTLSHLRPCVDGIDVALCCLDDDVAAIERHDDARLRGDEIGPGDDQLAYIIYTSGSTGRPKGVAIEHSGICNFVRVAADVYGIQPDDRMYQGMTIAFDFSVEELWVPLVAGATLVPRPSGPNLVGRDLADFVVANDITAMCCVPTLLATVDVDLPQLRFLLVSGETCPYDLVVRWYRDDRVFLNVYGPTEASVTATWTHLHPDASVTIGVPLPTYTVVVLDPDEPRALPHGSTGELAIAGVCLSTGYVNRDDLTARAFIPDFLDLPDNPSGRIYRTGDLARVNDDGEIEYLGRIDTQVKVRGYRIELAEIEAVMRQVPGIAHAVVNTHEAQAGLVELVGYYTLEPGEDGSNGFQAHLADALRVQLPGYMVPSYFEVLPELPTLPSGKVDRKQLPPPSGKRFVPERETEVVAPANDLEATLATALAEVLQVDEVSVEDHFFDDLGANSLLVAQFGAKVRDRVPDCDASMRDMYQHPTVRTLAAFIAERAPRVEVPVAERQPVHMASTPAYVGCALVQFGFYVATSILAAYVLVTGFSWMERSDHILEFYARAVLYGLGTFAVLCVIPVVLKWLLIGRWKEQTIPIWSLRYLRFWAVKQTMRLSPIAAFSGSPLYNLYLRSMGAKIGRNALVFTNRIVCTDLIAIGANTVVRADVSMYGYRAVGGRITTGTVTIGDDVIVGDASLLDIGTAIEDGAQFAHASALHTGQVVPAGKRYHGSPAEETDEGWYEIDARPCGAARRTWYSVGQLLSMFAVSAPFAFGIIALVLSVDVTLVGGSLLVYFGLLLLGLVLTIALPRALHVLVKPEQTYPLYGFRWWAYETTRRLSNASFYNMVFGDSSYIVPYLRAVGLDLGENVVQTGSNFGVSHKWCTPFASHIGHGTLVSDGLSIINVNFSSSSFKVSHARIGEENFLGNAVTWPAQSAVGDNCLLATKVMIPTGGEVRQDVGLLGSPAFEIPRSVQRDARFDKFKEPEELQRRLKRKNRSNLATMALFLFSRWVYAYAAILILVSVAQAHHAYDTFSVATATFAVLGFTLFYFGVIERLSTGLRGLSPQYCSIYEPYFWFHERYWKINETNWISLFDGTPFKGWAWRMLGVKVGKKLYDDGADVVEKTMVEIGDYCTLAPGATMQSHSLEDGTFKSDRIKIGNRCTLATESFAHYGVVMGDDVLLESDSFLMKGETPRPGSTWRANPAREVRC